LAAHRLTGLWIMPDEAIYATRGIALWHRGSLPLNGQLAGYGVLYPLFAGLPLSIGKVSTGLATLKIVQSIGMSLVAIPLFTYGRRLMPAGYALIAAALAVASPLLLYSGLVMTEVLFYPLSALALLAIARAVETSTLRDQFVALALIAAAVLTRVQAAVFVVAFVAAILLEALFTRTRPKVRAFWPVWTIAAAGAAVALAAPGILGAYAVTVGGSYPLGTGLRLTYDHLAFFALSTAVAPFAALVYLLIEAVRGREQDPRARALIAVTSAMVVLVTAQVGFFAARFAPHLLGRDLSSLPPLVFLTFGLWLSRERTHSRTRIGAAVAVAALIAIAPWNSLASANALPDSFGIALLLRWHWLSPDHLALVAALIGMGLFAAVPRRLFLVLPALMLAMLVASSTVAASEIEQQVSAAQTNLVGSPPNWVDRATTSPVAYLYNGETYWNSVWQVLFWNTRVQRVLTVWPSVVTGPMDQTSVTVPATGRLPTTDRYLVASDRNELYGTPVAHLTQTGLDVSGLTLWRLDRPARLSLVKTNIQPNGDILGSVPAAITVYNCTGGQLHLTLLPKATSVVRVTLDGQQVVKKSLVGLPLWQTTIPVPPSTRPRECVFAITGQGLLGSTVVEFQR
jgi:Dolichyl-phosphate-mannose-protein mannosyltransferase